MLSAYGHYKYFNSYSALDVRIVCSRQILMSKVDPRAVRVKPGLSLDLPD